MTTRSRDGAIAVAIAAIALVVWKLRLFDSATIPMSPDIGARDFYLQIYPMSHRAAEWMRHGVLPLWNPYQFAGQPFLATSLYGVLYPPNAFYLFLSTGWAIEAVLAFHIALAGVATFAFARTIDLSPPAALTAAAGYMLSGFVLFEASWFVAAASAAAWLPLALLAIERIAERRAFGWSFLLAAAIAMPYLAGYPQTWVYSLYAIGAYAAIRLAPLVMSSASRRHAMVAAALVALGVVAGLALCAVQLLPAYELQRLGPRQTGGLTRAQILPFGDMPLEIFERQALDASPGMPRPPYIGILPLLLIPLSLLIGRPLMGRAILFAALAVFSVGVALSTRLLDVYLALPALAWFRGPQRILFLYAFAGAILSGIGVEVLARGKRRPAALVIALATAAALASVVRPLSTLSLAYVSVGLVLILATALSGGVVRRLGLVLLAALVIWDLGHAARNEWMHPAHNPELFDRLAGLFDYVHEHQGLDRTYIVPPQPAGRRAALGLPLSVAAMAKQGTLREIYSITDYEPLCLSRYRTLYTELGAPAARTVARGVFNGGMQADPRRAQFRLLDLLSVRFMAVPVIEPETSFALRQRSGEWRSVPIAMLGYELFERTEVLPRAYVAFAADHASGEAEALAAIEDTSFDPRRRVVIEDAAPLVPPAPAADAPAPIVPANIVAYEPARVVIETNAPEAGHLVLTDTFYPGWRATVDGEAQPILRANYLFRAVAVPPGKHTVTFRYAPASFTIGALITLTTLAAMLVFGAREAFSRRRRAGRSPVPS